MDREKETHGERRWRGKREKKRESNGEKEKKISSEREREGVRE